MKKNLPALLVSCLFLLSSQNVFAAGYEIQEQSSKGLGQAFAGRSTGFGDGSEVYYNPASMSALGTDVFTIGTAIVFPSSKFRNEDSGLPSALGGGPLRGDNGGDGGSTTVVPSTYYVRTIDDRFKVGLGINAPFGLRSSYDSSWVGRYNAVKSELISVNINPAVSYKVLDDFTIGLGLNNMYLDAELTNAVDFGSIGAATLGAQRAAALGLSPQNNDGFARLEGDDWAHGFTLGAMINLLENTRVGLAYRGKLEATVDGKASFNVPANAMPLTATGLFTNTTAEAELVTPETFSAGLTHEFNERLALSLEGTWTRWSRFKEIRVEFPGALPDSVTPENWENTWRIAGGVNYAVNPCLTLRAGAAWDETPVPSAVFRTPRIPDENRIWATIGSSWYMTDNMTIDLAYAHLFMDDAHSTNTNSTGSVLSGNYDLSIDIISLGLTWELG